MKLLPCPFVLLVFALLVFALPAPLYAQDWTTIEAMEEVLAQEKITDQERLEAWYNLAEAYLHCYGPLPSANAQLVTQYLDKADSLAAQIQYLPSIVRGLYSRGYFNAKTGNISMASLFFDSAYSIAYPTMAPELAYISYGKGYLALVEAKHQESLNHLHNAVALAHQAEDWRLEAWAHQRLGTAYFVLRNKALGNKHYKEAEKTWFLAFEKPYIPYLYWRISNHIGLHHYGKQIKYIDLAEELASERGDSSLLFYLYTAKLLIFMELNDAEQTNHYLGKAQEFAVNSSLNYINQVNTGIYHRRVNHNYDSAMHYLQRSRAAAMQAVYHPWKVDIYLELGTTETTFGNAPKALTYYQQALDLAEKYNTRFRFVDANLSIAECYNTLGSYNKALHYFNVGLDYSFDEGIEWVTRATKGMAATHYHMGSYEKAYKYHMLYARYNDSLQAVQDAEPVLRQSFIENLSWQQDSLALLSNAQVLQTRDEARHQRLITFFWALCGILTIGLLVTFVLLLRIKA